MSQRLTKHPADRVWAGVCAGIARWLGVDPVLVRLAWLAWAVFGDTGTAVLAYVALLVVLPDPSRAERRGGERAWAEPARTSGHPAAPTPPSASAVRTAAAPTAVAIAPPPAPPAPGSRPPSPTADELGNVLLKLLDTTATVAVRISRAAVLAARAAFVTGHMTYRAAQPRGDARRAGAAVGGVTSADRSPAPSPAAATDAPPTASSAATTPPTAAEPHIESDEERLQQQIRDRLESQVAGARTVIAASGPQATAGERARRRGRLRQLAGFGILAFGAWGLATTLNVHPVAITGASLATFAGASVVIAAVLICLGTYLLWTAVRRHP